MRCMLNTGRTVGQGMALEVGKTSAEYYDEVAVAFMNGDDMDDLGIAENAPVKASSGSGSVVVRARKGQLDRGNVFIPVGPWANALIGGDTGGTGMPRFKGMWIELSKTEDGPTSLNDLLPSKDEIVQAPDQSPPPTSSDEDERSIVTDVVCPFCGCLCDDVELVMTKGKITDIEIGCDITRSRFVNWDRDRAKAAVRKKGKLVEVPLKEALDKAADILKGADFPLIYGLSSTEVDAQRRAIELAELLGATIDNTSSVCHGPTVVAAQDVGVSKCTLGEVRNRADLVIYWGCNPAEAHIRHITRYSGTPEGMYSPDGRDDRTIVHVDVRETKTSQVDPRWKYTYQLADQFIKVRQGQDYELLSALRATLKGHDVGDVAGVPASAIKELADRMKSCKFGIIFFGLGLTMSDGRHMNVNAALRLVRDLNDHTKFTILPMRGHYNVTGINAVMTWTTGYPFAVNLSRGYPVYNPGEFSAVDMLARKECDAALIIASDPAANFPREAVEHLSKIPTIVIDPKLNLTSPIADVLIPSAIAGIECEGTAYRMDGIPIRLRKVVESDQLPDKVVLEKLIERVRP